MPRTLSKRRRATTSVGPVVIDRPDGSSDQRPPYDPHTLRRLLT